MVAPRGGGYGSITAYLRCYTNYNSSNYPSKLGYKYCSYCISCVKNYFCCCSSYKCHYSSYNDRYKYFC